MATAPQGFSSATVHWTVNPSTATHITSINEQAMVLIASPGTYQVVVSNFGADSIVHDSSYATITVIDSVYSPVINNFDTLSLAGDRVTLTPTAASDSGILFLAQSGKSYDCFPSFIYSLEEGLNGAGGISIHFYSIVSGNATGNCNGSKNPAVSYLFATQAGKIPAGNYPFSVTINNSTYQGSLSVTATDYSFTWNDESEVIISPKKIKKN